jgi:hypothetical protein
MDSKVIVMADEATGTVVNVSENNPQYGYIKLQQVRNVIDDNGFLRRKPVNALLPGTVKSLNLFAGQALTGKIVIEESLEPFNAKAPARDLKIAGSTGIVCTWNGLPIYRRTKFSFDVTCEDSYQKHDNVDELRSAYATQSGASNAIKPNEDFSIEG